MEHRKFELRWVEINGARMKMNKVNFKTTLNATEIWTVRNTDHRPHNFHVHDVQFQVVDIDKAAPPAELSGWKDTIYIRPGSAVRLILRFTDYSDPTFPYMYHCHMLMHEDHGMMGQFLVLGPGQTAEPLPMPQGQ